MAVRASNPASLEWASPFRAAMGGYEQTFRMIQERDSQTATRWRVAKLRAERALSDGYFADYEKWEARADRLEGETLGHRVAS